MDTDDAAFKYRIGIKIFDGFVKLLFLRFGADAGQCGLQLSLDEVLVNTEFCENISSGHQLRLHKKRKLGKGKSYGSVLSAE